MSLDISPQGPGQGLQEAILVDAPRDEEPLPLLARDLLLHRQEGQGSQPDADSLLLNEQENRCRILAKEMLLHQQE